MRRKIYATKDTRQYYVVRFGWDEGGPESGPIIKSDEVVIKARSKQDAEAKVLSKMRGLDGASAHLASQQEIDDFVEYIRDANDEYDAMVEAGLIDPDLDAEMNEALDPDRFKKMSADQLRDYYYSYVDGYEFRTFADWVKFLKETGSR